MPFLPLFLAALTAPQAAPAARESAATPVRPPKALSVGLAPAYDHVLLVSVDGLRADALMEPGIAELPAFQRLLTGAHTLDARTDPDDTRTLPNHVGMLTGRRKRGDEGHRWNTNSTPEPELELHDIRGDRTQGVFHVLTAAGVDGAVVAQKEKFLLFPRSWEGTDAERASSVGRVELYGYALEDAIAVETVDAFLAARAGQRAFAMLHLRGPDKAGHASGWEPGTGTPYFAAVRAADAALADLLARLDADPARRARTAIVLTSDHGGGVPRKSHLGRGRGWVNVAIPFTVWTGDGQASGDLYARNPYVRAAPGLRDPRGDAPGPPPVRNLDAANLCLALLGLDPVPGSTVGRLAPLRWGGPASAPLR
jgi:hypothetical protein